MAQKKLLDVTLFLSGEPDNAFPDKAFVSYKVKAGKAESKQKNYEIADLDSDLLMSDVFAGAMAEIKQFEGVV